MSACVIRIDRADNGRYRASCTLFPGYEATGETEEAARLEMDEAVQRYLHEGRRPESAEPSTGPT
jgi:predicted RNase H-like HicB family nuclease